MKYKCNNDIKMNIPKDVDFIIKKLEENGYEAFAVGGCVRDTIPVSYTHLDVYKRQVPT